VRGARQRPCRSRRRLRHLPAPAGVAARRNVSGGPSTVTGTMLLTAIAAVALILAALPALLYRVNIRLYRPAPPPAGDLPAVSVLIPARNEESTIGSAVAAALASRGVQLEVIVLDDDSDDRTADVVTAFAASDGRVRLLH